MTLMACSQGVTHPQPLHGAADACQLLSLLCIDFQHGCVELADRALRGLLQAHAMPCSEQPMHAHSHALQMPAPATVVAMLSMRAACEAQHSNNCKLASFGGRRARSFQGLGHACAA